MASRSEGTWWALWASDVPPLGYKSYRIEVANEERSALPASDSHVLENNFYRLTADPSTGGLASIVDKQTGKELVDPDADWTAGQLLHETLSSGRDFHRDGFERKGPEGVTLRPGVAGPIWKSLEVHGELDGCATPKGALVEVRLYEPEKRIELHYAIRKLPLTRPEAIYVAFPFVWPDGQIVYEAQGGMVRPGRDQIPRYRFRLADRPGVPGRPLRSGPNRLGQRPGTACPARRLEPRQMAARHANRPAPCLLVGDEQLLVHQLPRRRRANSSGATTSRRSQTPPTRRRLDLDGRLESRSFPVFCPLASRPVLTPNSRSSKWTPPTSPWSRPIPARYSDGVVLHLRELDGKRTTLRVSTMPSSSTGRSQRRN